MSNNITYASIVPLIGGENLGIMGAMNNQLPEYILSYTPFAKNDSHFISYLREKYKWEGDYVFLDAEGNESYKPTKKVNVVNTVCPCAGLSSLSVTSSADSEMNEWMYKTAEYVLGTIGPDMFWGENAPRLFTNAGKKVADRLYNIGRENGYTLNLYYTESRLHGIAQKRPRTFYFFTKGEKTPIFKYFRREMQPADDILQMATNANDPMNVCVNKKNPTDNPWVAYCMHKAGAKTLMEYHDKLEKSTNCIVTSDKISDSLNEVADWMDAQGFDEKYGKRARAMQQKLDDGKGYWAHGVTMPKGEIPSLIGALPSEMINPYTGNYLSIRDCLRIMKMPEDFNLLGEKPENSVNHICQNVPVTTAGDMMTNVVEYFNGECDMVDATYVKQSNAAMKHEIVDDAMNTQSLEEFFSLHKG